MRDQRRSSAAGVNPTHETAFYSQGLFGHDLTFRKNDPPVAQDEKTPLSYLNQAQTDSGV